MRLPELAAVPHGWRGFIERERLLHATYQFNPTLALDGDSIWMAYRRISPDEWLAGPRTIAMCRIGPDFQPVEDSNVDLSARIVDPPGADRWHADPRFFQRGDNTWMSYHDNYRLYLCTFNPESVPQVIEPVPVTLAGSPPRERERNWGFFDVGGVLHAVYTINPLVIVTAAENPDGFAATRVDESRAGIPWDAKRWGEPHGGSMPVRVGDCWFAFFQSASFDESTNRRHYRAGFYGFDAAPPYRLRMMSREPVLDSSEFPDPPSFYQDWSVVYPSGAVHLDGRWLVSLGIHDRLPALAIFDHQTLLDGCERLS